MDDNTKAIVDRLCVVTGELAELRTKVDALRNFVRDREVKYAIEEHKEKHIDNSILFCHEIRSIMDWDMSPQAKREWERIEKWQTITNNRS